MRAAGLERELSGQGDRDHVRKLQLGPRTHKYPITAGLRAWLIVTRAQAAVSAGRPAVSSSLLLPGSGRSGLG